MSELDEQVKDAVLEWGRTRTLSEGAKRLEDSRRRLSKEQVALLRDEIAEIVAETLILLLTRKESDAKEYVEAWGTSMPLLQAQRIAAWVEDQPRTAEALGLTREAWTTEVQNGVVRHLEARPEEKTAEQQEQDEETVAKAAKTIGRSIAQFENRPNPGSKRAGIAGIIAARRFDSSVE